MVRKCMEHRLSWKTSSIMPTTTYNLRWKDVSCGIDFNGKGGFKQMINHYENHCLISNKLNLFINFLRYCEKKNLDIFKFLPFTVLIQYSNSCLNDQIENFREIFSNITNYIFDPSLNLIPNNTISTAFNSDPFKKIILKRYGNKFIQSYSTSSEKLGNKTYISIAPSHYDGRNLWLVKAVNLNRGRGIKITSNFDEILNFCKLLNTGISKKVNITQYRDNEVIKEEEETSLEKKEKKNPKETYMNPIRTIRNRNIENNDKDKEKDSSVKKPPQDARKYSESIGKIIKSIYRSSIVILQKYIEKPYLYFNRKCDLRIWVLINHKQDIFVFKEGHFKVSSVNFNLYSTDTFTHLTNYSVQKHSPMFSYYEIGNEISYSDFQKCINLTNPGVSFINDVLPSIYNIIRLSLLSINRKLLVFPNTLSFEIFGYDFILDEKLNPYLLEVNTNPGYDESSPLINKIIPRMIDDCLRLTIDDVFPTVYLHKDKKFTKEDYESPFPVNGYTQNENMWDFLINLKNTKL